MRKIWRSRYGSLSTGVHGWEEVKALQYILQAAANEMQNKKVVRITIRRLPDGWSLNAETRQPLSWWLKFWKFWQFREP